MRHVPYYYTNFKPLTRVQAVDDRHVHPRLVGRPCVRANSEVTRGSNESTELLWLQEACRFTEKRSGSSSYDIGIIIS